MHGGGEAYEDGVIVDGNTTTIIATENTPLLYYYCENHPTWVQVMLQLMLLVVG